MDSLSRRPPDNLPTPPSIPVRRRWLLVLMLTVVAMGAVWGAYSWHRRRVEIAPRPFSSPFLNTRPGVGYVGSGRCGDCHPAEAATYAEHPMGRSVSAADRWLPAQDKADPSFEASGLRYAVERRGEQVWHREYLPREKTLPAVEIAAEVAFTVGSGRQGQSFLVNRAGRYFQSPISWYSGEKAWKLAALRAGQ